MISLIVHLAITILAIWYFTRPIRKEGTLTDEPLEILRKRFAKGDLTEDEFEEHKSALKKEDREK